MRSRLQVRAFRVVCFLLLYSAAVALNGCAHQPTPEAFEPPGFWSGLLHGFLILFSFIGSLFTDVRIYAFPNSGGWYDFGYLIGASVFRGGGGASSTLSEAPHPPKADATRA
jgi:hypothetical protein